MTDSQEAVGASGKSSGPLRGEQTAVGVIAASTMRQNAVNAIWCCSVWAGVSSKRFNSAGA